MREALKVLAKKVTLELIYEAVDERTTEIKVRLDRIESKVESEFHEVKAEIRSINTRIDQLFTAILNLSEKK